MYSVSYTLTPTYKVTFEGASTTETLLAGKDTPVVKPTTPIKEGYTFAGWYKGDTVWNFDDPVTSDMTLTARFTKKSSSPGGGNGGGNTTPINGGGSTNHSTYKGTTHSGSSSSGVGSTYTPSTSTSTVVTNKTYAATTTQAPAQTVVAPQTGDTMVDASLLMMIAAFSCALIVLSLMKKEK